MYLSSALWKNGRSDPDVVWHGRSDRSMDEKGSGVWRSGNDKGVIWGGANMGRPIVTNGGLFTIGNSHCAAARLLLGQFLELRARRAGDACRLRLAVASTLSNAALSPRDRKQTCVQ